MCGTMFALPGFLRLLILADARNVRHSDESAIIALRLTPENVATEYSLFSPGRLPRLWFPGCEVPSAG